MSKARHLFAVLSELQAKDKAVSVYIEYISNAINVIQPESTTEDEKERFSETHLSLITLILSTLETELSAASGRLLQVFGGSLWYRVSLELIQSILMIRYKRFIQEALDTEGKSKQLFLETLDLCVRQARDMFTLIRERVLTPNQLDLDQELEQMQSALFSEY